MTKLEQQFQQAFALHQVGKIIEAETLYRRLLRKNPTHVQTLYLLGTACSQQGRHEEAELHLERALALNPNHVEALNNMGLALKGRDKVEEAISYFRRALEIKPDYDDAHDNLAVCLESMDKLEEAEIHARRALELNPNHSGACFAMGLIMKKKDRFEESIQYLWRGLELKPDTADAYNDLGAIYKLWGRYEESLSCLERSLALVPDKYEPLNNLGATLEELGRNEEALEVYRRAARVNPDDPIARWNCSLLYIKLGILDKGWDDYELRFDANQALKRLPFPLWDGSSLEGKTILICAEQGLGDEILFASCFQDLIDLGGNCVIECDPRLASLYARSFPAATITGCSREQFLWPNNVRQIDFQVYEGSLPKYFRRNLESFPKKHAYLFADPAMVEYSRSRLSLSDAGLKVGICWRSGLTTGERFKYYSELTQWEEIFGLEGVHFVNLQYDECSAELRAAEEKFGIKITTFPDLDMKNNLDATAALISSLDIVISAATAVAEMSGALGVATFRPEPHGKTWTSLGTDAMPWHPNMRLFHQPVHGDWETPLALIAEAIREKLRGHANAVDYISLPGNLEIAVDGSLENPSTYVLKEQQGGFDQEYAFLPKLAESGMRIVDVGSGIGAYAGPMAKAGASVWAFAKTAQETDLLLKTRMKNRLKDKLTVSIIDRNFSLDAEMNRYGLDEIAILRIATEFATPGLLDRGNQFFSINSPLAMFGIGTKIEMEEGWGRRGYRLFRYIPGLTLLVPFASSDELDAFSLNLFACKEDRALMLEKQGKLIRQFHVLESFPGADQICWQAYLKDKPYASSLLEMWMENPQKERDWEVYWMALNLFALAKSEKTDAAKRYACLQTAAGFMHSLVQESASIPRLLSLCRMMIELGMREAAVHLLNHICAHLDSGIPVSEPLLTLSARHESIDPGDRMTDWIKSMILEERERLRAFSSFFTGSESLPLLEEIRESGFLSPDMARRLDLMRQRYGK